MPRNAVTVIALGMTRDRSDVADALTRGNELAHQLLGVENEGGYWAPDKLGVIAALSPAKATQVALAIVLGGIEAHTSKNTWRNPTGRAAAYFRQLVDWGYAASEVEQIVMDAAPVDAADVEDTDPGDNE